jgi:hypothetical protein
LLQQYTLTLTLSCSTTQSHLNPIHISNVLQLKNIKKEIICLIFNNGLYLNLGLVHPVCCACV